MKKIKQRYHLTPTGWVKGFLRDEAGNFTENPDIPADRVYTVLFVDDDTPPLRSIKSTEDGFMSDNKDLVERLFEQYPLDMLPFPEDE